MSVFSQRWYDTYYVSCLKLFVTKTYLSLHFFRFPVKIDRPHVNDVSFNVMGSHVPEIGFSSDTEEVWGLLAIVIPIKKWVRTHIDTARYVSRSTIWKAFCKINIGITSPCIIASIIALYFMMMTSRRPKTFVLFFFEMKCWSGVSNLVLFQNNSFFLFGTVWSRSYQCHVSSDFGPLVFRLGRETRFENMDQWISHFEFSQRVCWNKIT